MTQMKSRTENTVQQQQLELARLLLIHAVDAVMAGCGNSYVNSYTEKWLRHAASLGAYQGPVVGVIEDLRDQWDAFVSVDESSRFPDLPDIVR